MYSRADRIPRLIAEVSLELLGHTRLGGGEVVGEDENGGGVGIYGGL